MPLCCQVVVVVGEGVLSVFTLCLSDIFEIVIALLRTALPLAVVETCEQRVSWSLNQVGAACYDLSSYEFGLLCSVEKRHVPGRKTLVYNCC